MRCACRIGPESAQGEPDWPAPGVVQAESARKDSDAGPDRPESAQNEPHRPESSAPQCGALVVVAGVLVLGCVSDCRFERLRGVATGGEVGHVDRVAVGVDHVCLAQHHRERL